MTLNRNDYIYGESLGTFLVVAGLIQSLPLDQRRSLHNHLSDSLSKMERGELFVASSEGVLAGFKSELQRYINIAAIEPD